MESTHTYGTIHFSPKHPIDKNGTLTFENGAILYNGKDISSGDKPTVKLEGSGGFPRTLIENGPNSQKYYEPQDFFPHVWLEVDSTTERKFASFIPKNGEMKSHPIDINDKNGNKCGEIRVSAK